MWIKGYYNHYSINCDGIIWSHKNGKIKIKSQYINKDGYAVVSIYNHPDKPKILKVHRIVAETFLNSFDKDLQVNHMDGDKLNNKVSNLEMTTSLGNIRHAVLNGLRAKTNGNAKLTRQLVKEIRELKGEYTQIEIADKFEISRITVDRIQNFRSWK